MVLQTLSSNGRIIHKNKMFNFYLDQEFVDTELILSDGKIKVHGIVLATESKLAYKLLKSLPGPQKTLRWTQYSKEIMRLVIEYIYRGTLTYPTHLESQVKSLIAFLQIEGNKQFSNKEKINSFTTRSDLITNVKTKNMVIEISDEELSPDSSVNNRPPETSPIPNIILPSSSDEIQEQTNPLLCSSTSQNEDDNKSIDFALIEDPRKESDDIEQELQQINNTELMIDPEKIPVDTNSQLCHPTSQNQDNSKSVHCTLLDESLSGTGSKSNEMEHNEREELIGDGQNTDNSGNNRISVMKLSKILIGKYLDEKNGSVTQKEQPGRNGSSDSIYFSLPANTYQSQLLEPEESLKGNTKDSSYLDDSLPNLRLSKNPYIQIELPITKNRTKNFPEMNFENDTLGKEDTGSNEEEKTLEYLRISSTENSINKVKNGDKSSKISIISDHKITAPNLLLTNVLPIKQQNEKEKQELFEYLPITENDITNNMKKKSDEIAHCSKNKKYSIESRRRSLRNQINNNCNGKRKRPAINAEKKRKKLKRKNSEYCDRNRDFLQVTKLGKKYCVICDKVKHNSSIHIQHNHKEVIRNALFTCDKCYTSFHYEVFKKYHVCV
ncbi:uncharacterized protein LOC130449330 [Diorhabda sublineata]|uniref:uncharacterized protein LOC130449330 n=1 Tax=Diorhabda sublineata TaxID=1163346 RepID=UPI0024E13052|nr:uncharacterized protein LOC130449330 [Diorhabda sublineata]